MRQRSRSVASPHHTAARTSPPVRRPLVAGNRTLARAVAAAAPQVQRQLDHRDRFRILDALQQMRERFGWSLPRARQVGHEAMSRPSLQAALEYLDGVARSGG